MQNVIIVFIRYRPTIDQGFRNWSIHNNRCYLRCSIQMGTVSFRSICYIFQSFGSFAMDSWNNTNELNIKSNNEINKILPRKYWNFRIMSWSLKHHWALILTVLKYIVWSLDNGKNISYFIHFLWYYYCMNIPTKHQFSKTFFQDMCFIFWIIESNMF